ncbi:S8 family peptidase [Natrinema salifodinae]|uniref:Subtilisin n=1 Tax=Natrinema salifodinae TaxID=1202768 RepID=A0A1I0N9K9_9EURY|nr:S8 family peptidase [Natrinema salifodinae]SEV97681.1 subtilisin [Natrinema salifodinae]
MPDEIADIGNLSRRNILKTVGAAGLTLGGIAGATSIQAQDTGMEEQLSTLDGQDRFNVEYADERGAERAKAVAEEVIYDIDPLNTVTIEASPEGLQELSEADPIEFIEADPRYRTGLPPQEIRVHDPDGQIVPWGVDRIGAPVAHEKGIRGETSHVAVINTGIDSTHEDLSASVGEGVAFTPCQGDCDAPWDDDHGHGTHVAGTIGALDNQLGVLGVAPETTLHAAKVLNQNGIGFASDVALGILWTAVQGYDVANMSLGGPFSPLVQAAVEFASEQGVLLISSAGNEAGPVSYPASADEVLAVSATTSDDELAWFSNFGPEIELAAPGVDVLSTFPNDNYGVLSGTSMASPHVSGTGALLMALGFTAGEARTFMMETAEDIGLPPEEQGAGLVNAAAVATHLKNKQEKSKTTH